MRGRYTKKSQRSQKEQRVAQPQKEGKVVLTTLAAQVGPVKAEDDLSSDTNVVLRPTWQVSWDLGDTCRCLHKGKQLWND